MKKLSGHVQPRFQPSKTLVLVLAAISVAFAGCGKKAASPAPTPSTATDTTQVAAPVPENRPAPVYNVPPTSVPTVATVSTGGADLKQLNHIYIGWIIQTHRRAKTYEEFAAASGVQVPPAPDGEKYVIDKNGFINVASR